MSIEIVDAARLVGAKPSEVASVEDADAGLIIHMVDGSAFIDVPEDHPDVDGKTGLMFLAAPLNPKGEYLGSFPVFSQPVEADGDVYPEKGSADEVLAWVSGDQERARFALDEEAEGKARKGLTEELNAILAQYGGDDDA